MKRHKELSEEKFEGLLHNLNLKNIGDYHELMGEHVHKCKSYVEIWDDANIPYDDGCAIFLLTFLKNYAKEVRFTKHGWIEPYKWVISNYPRFQKHLQED